MLCHQTMTALGLVGALLEELLGKCMVLSVETNDILFPYFLRISVPAVSFFWESWCFPERQGQEGRDRDLRGGNVSTTIHKLVLSWKQTRYNQNTPNQRLLTHKHNKHKYFIVQFQCLVQRFPCDQDQHLEIKFYLSVCSHLFLQTHKSFEFKKFEYLWIEFEVRYNFLNRSLCWLHP